MTCTAPMLGHEFGMYLGQYFIMVLQNVMNCYLGDKLSLFFLSITLNKGIFTIPMSDLLLNLTLSFTNVRGIFEV